MPAVVPERFADVLIGRPCFPAWSRQSQADACESVRIAEIGHVERLHSVAPYVSRKLLQRWYAPLGQVAIPLGPQRLLLIGEVEGVDYLAALPPVVAWRRRPEAWVSAVRDVTQPRSGGVNRIDVERQRTVTSDSAGRLELRNDPGDLACSASSDQLERLLIVERLDRLRQPDRNVVRVDHTS